MESLSEIVPVFTEYKLLAISHYNSIASNVALHRSVLSIALYLGNNPFSVDKLIHLHATIRICTENDIQISFMVHNDSRSLDRYIYTEKNGSFKTGQRGICRMFQNLSTHHALEMVNCTLQAKPLTTKYFTLGKLRDFIAKQQRATSA